MQTINFQGDLLSRLSLGTVQLGMEYGIANKSGKPSMQKSCDILSAAVENGVNCFDTALAYGDSEMVLGACLGQEAHVISKVSSKEFENLESKVKASLKRLNRERLYGLLLHDSGILKNWGQRERDKILKLKKNGMIKYFGLSIYEEEEFKRALEIDEITLIQVPFNLLDDRFIKYRWEERAEKGNRLLFVRSIYLQGLIFLGSRNLPEHLKEAQPALERLEELAKEQKMTLPELAMDYVKYMAANAVILFGAEDKDQVVENIETFDRLAPVDHETIEEILSVAEKLGPHIYNPSLWRKN